MCVYSVLCVQYMSVCPVTVEDAVDPRKGWSGGGGGELMVGQFSGEGHIQKLSDHKHTQTPQHINLQPCLMILPFPQQPVEESKCLALAFCHHTVYVCHVEHSTAYILPVK